MTVPYLHDQIFDDIRRNGPERPVAPVDATRVARNLPSAPGSLPFAPSEMRAAGPVVPTARQNTYDKIREVSATVPPAILMGIASTPFEMAIGASKAKNPDELLFALTGIRLAVDPKSPAHRPRTTGERVEQGLALGLLLAPELLPTRTAGKTVPAVRMATDAEASAVVAALRRAPAGSKEANLLNDLMRIGESPKAKAFQREVEQAIALDQLTPEQLRQTRLRDPGHVSPDVSVIEDLLNLRAFSSRRGPFSTSGKHAYDLGDLPPIADADEVFGFTKSPKPVREQRRRFVITEQMRDPEMISGKAAQQELRDITLREKLNNALLRAEILEEAIPSHITQGPLQRAEATAQVKPMNLFQMFFTPKGTKQ